MDNETVQTINSIVNIGGLIVSLIIIPLLTVGGKYIISWLESKKELAKTQTESTAIKSYIDDIFNFSKKVILATNQTYVDSLKQNGTFTVESQKIAFEKSKTAIIALLNEEKITILKKAVGDFDKFIENVIESEVKRSKQNTLIESSLAPIIEVPVVTETTNKKEETTTDVK